MPIAVLALALATYLYSLIASRTFRIWGIALGVGVALALVFYMQTNAPQSALETQRIAPEQLTLDQTALTRNGRGATLTGRVLNGSPTWRLRDMTLILHMRDCPPDAADITTCPIIGEASALTHPDAPPGQIRGFSALFALPNLPPVVGELRWDWRITATRATD